MRCEEVRERFADYLAGTAGPPAGDVLEHLSSCARCGAEFVELSDLWNDLGELDTPRPDSVALRRSFDMALAVAGAGAERRGVLSLFRWKASARMVRAAFATAAGLAVAVALWQTEMTLRNGVIDGVAQEVDGVPISGATIRVASASGSQRMTVTRPDGTWEIRDVPAGRYSVTADITGFQTARYSNVMVEGDGTLRLPFKLQGGAVSTAIELSLNGEAPTQMALALPAEGRELVKDKVASVDAPVGWADALLGTNIPRLPEAERQQDRWAAYSSFSREVAKQSEYFDAELRARPMNPNVMQSPSSPASPAGRGAQAQGDGGQGGRGAGRGGSGDSRNITVTTSSGISRQVFGFGGGGRADDMQLVMPNESITKNTGYPVPADSRKFDYYSNSGGINLSEPEMVDEKKAAPPPPPAAKPAAVPASPSTGQYGKYSTPDGVVRWSDSATLPPDRQMAAAAAATIIPSVPGSVVGGLPGGRGMSSSVSRIDEDGLRERRPFRILGLDIPFTQVSQQPLATFGSDVDTASYANVRRYLASGQWPPRNAVRIEELINYFHYDYPQGSTDRPITASMEAASAPWNPDHRLIRVGIKAREVRMDRKAVNLVFLIDVSGSMNQPAKLPLLKSSLRMLVDRLGENDTVTIVTYADASGIALAPTNGSRKDVLLRAIDNLAASGNTNGGAGIQTAYAAAVANFVRGGVNRVILATDGDFNVGITNTSELIRLIEDKARTGVFLSVLGFGSDNLKDGMMEQLADHGNGNYAYIDTLNEGRKVLIDEMAGTLVTVAKDVKIQVEFNPAEAIAYRLIGYENRVLANADFANDSKDAGDMGAGQTVTALFEVIPRGVTAKDPAGDPLRFQPAAAPAPAADRKTSGPNELLNLKVRYKDPDGVTSKAVELLLVDRGQPFGKASADFRFAAAVASFGMALRTGNPNLDSTLEIAQGSRGNDRSGLREEFIQMVERARMLFGWGVPVG